MDRIPLDEPEPVAEENRRLRWWFHVKHGRFHGGFHDGTVAGRPWFHVEPSLRGRLLARRGTCCGVGRKESGPR